MSCVAADVFERPEKENHSNDPALSVDGLSDFWPAQTSFEMDSALAVGGLNELFPGREGDAVDYFSVAHDAPTTTCELLAEPCELPAETSADDELCESTQTFESGHIFQSDIQRAAMEFQRFAERFHAFAAKCQERVTA